MTLGSIDVFPLPRGPAPDQLGTVGGWWITSYFGGRPNPFTGSPSWHGGMDLAAPKMTPMYAVKPGRIFQAWDPGGGGNWTRLQCDDGDMFGYGHADHFAPGANGRHVEAGEIIAYVNSTGASTGNHLHFAYQPYGLGRYGDPYDCLTGCHTFVGSPAQQPTPPPPPPAPEEDIMASKEELEQIVNAAKDQVIAAVIAATPPPQDDQLWMGTHAGQNRVYIVAHGVKMHVPGDLAGSLGMLVQLGYDNRGVQDAALDVLPEQAFRPEAA